MDEYEKMRDILYYNISKDGKTIQFTEETKGKGIGYKGIQYVPVTYLEYIKKTRGNIDTYTFTLNFTGLGNLVLLFTHKTGGYNSLKNDTIQIYCDNGRGNRFALQIESITIRDRVNVRKKGKKIDIVFKTSLPNCFQMSNIKSAAIERIMKKKKRRLKF
tara:strand:+ start:278 stop:757 length:480 start_codon:yes stop_codon:yes gene_type:complete